MIRVLQVYPQLNNAGTEMVIMNFYNNIDREKVQFDFLVEKPGELDNQIIDMGGNIFYIQNQSKKKYYQDLLDFFNLHKSYNIVHTHTHARMGIVLKAAKKTGIKCRIAHSHNARTDLPKLVTIYKRITGRVIEHNATNFFACSQNAAKWLFPTKYSQCRVIYNAIDLKRFNYSEESRAIFREKYNIDENSKLVCHVGRFAEQKNHKFLIDVAKEVIDRDRSIKFILVGVGPLMDKVKKQVRDYKIGENILFLGNRKDVNDVMSASDMFILPSFHEGLGIVLIEAQANGLFCIASEGVPVEADIGINLMERNSLSNGASNWANQILNKLYIGANRKQLSDNAMTSDYNIFKVAKKMQDFYLGIEGEANEKHNNLHSYL